MSGLSSIMMTLGALPHLAVCVVGLVFAISRWTRHPQASMMVTVGLVLEVMTALGSVAAPMISRSDFSQLGLVYGALRLVGSVGFGLIVASVFVERARGDEPPTPRF